MPPVSHCLGFAIDCGTIFKGVGVVLMGFILFVGSIYLLLTAIFGRYMAYLVVIVALSGWLIIQSSLWLIGFKSQGPVTPTNLGPKGAVAAWVVLDAENGATSTHYTDVRDVPGFALGRAERQRSPAAGRRPVGATGRWRPSWRPSSNETLKIDPDDPTAIQTTAFTVDDLRFATAPDGDAPRGGAGPLQRRRAAMDGVPVLRQGQRAPLLVSCSSSPRS